MFENLKSLFVTIEEDLEVESTSNVASTEKKAPEPTKSSSPEPTQNANTDIKDEAIEAKLFKALEDNNQPGFDYFEYKRSLKSLEKFPMDEATKYQSAFATAATMDVTLDKLVGSVEFYKKVLKQEETNFLKASKEQYLLNVENKKSDIVDIPVKMTSLLRMKLTTHTRLSPS